MTTRLPTASYLVLGLLSLRDWSAYEIVEQLGKGVGEVWRRVDRRLYDVPKRLVELGLITARTETSAGRRTRTVYSITAEGRGELAGWIGTGVQPSTMEFDGLVRVLFADAGTIDELRENLREIAGQARVRRELFIAHANFAIASDGGTMPERAHLFALANRYMIEHFTLMITWAEWALAETESWPDAASPAQTHRDQMLATFRDNTHTASDRTTPAL